MSKELLQAQLNKLEKDKQLLISEIEDQGYKIIDGKVVQSSSKIYAVEIMSYDRTEYDSYGWVNLKRNVIPVSEEIIFKIKSLSSEELEEYFLNNLIDTYKKYITENIIDIFDSNNIQAFNIDDEVYHDERFIAEVCYHNCDNSYDFYMCFFESSYEEIDSYEYIDIEIEKIIREN